MSHPLCEADAMTDTVPLTDLLSRCQRGDAAAQQQLFRRTYPKLLQVCQRYARDRPEAEDMLQEAYLTIFKDIHQYRGTGALEGWLHRITVRTALRWLRRKNPLRFAEELDATHENAYTFEAEAYPLDAEALLHLLQQMPAGYRAVFNMRCLEGFSYEEIAAELDIAEVTARTQYTRACKHLRSLTERFLGCLL